MLKILLRKKYEGLIPPDKQDSFFEIIKWFYGIELLINNRQIICGLITDLIALSCLIFINNKIYSIICSYVFCAISITILVLDYKRTHNQKEIIGRAMGLNTPSMMRNKELTDFFKKFVSLNGKALGRKEWRKIKEHDIGLYKDLLSDECGHLCYYYSLEIAKIIKDSILILGAAKDNFSKDKKKYAHAVILRNGYIYDSNIRQSIKYEDFERWYEFQIYKKWNYSEYSQENFRNNVRNDFRSWCEENNVKSYRDF